MNFKRVLNSRIRIEYDVYQPNQEQESRKMKTCVFAISSKLMYKWHIQSNTRKAHSIL